jgi:hypothetical protein
MYIGKVHLPVGGRVVCLIKSYYATHNSKKLSMRKSWKHRYRFGPLKFEHMMCLIPHASD